jgi:hypothetical protein
MKSLLTRKLVIAAIAIAVLGGGAAAVAAATQSSSPHQAYLDDVAKRLGVSPSALASAVRGASVDRIQSAVAEGRLSQAQASVLEARVREGKGPLFGHRFRSGLREGLETAAAKYLGIGASVLRGDRRGGKSLAEIAASTPGKSAAGLKEALLADAKSRLDAAVSTGRISSDAARARLAALTAHIQALLERKSPGLASAGPKSRQRALG